MPVNNCDIINIIHNTIQYYYVFRGEIQINKIKKRLTGRTDTEQNFPGIIYT